MCLKCKIRLQMVFTFRFSIDNLLNIKNKYKIYPWINQGLSLGFDFPALSAAVILHRLFTFAFVSRMVPSAKYRVISPSKRGQVGLSLV